MVTLDEAADELYGTSPVDFVSRREALTRQARADKDRVLATQIKALRRPTVSAWVLNTLIREGLQSLTELLEVGARLRTAQAMLDAAELKRLTAARQQLERQILISATARFKQLGETLTPATLSEIEGTLRAAVADPAAATALASGHLTRPLTYAGFGAVDLTSATAITPSAGTIRTPAAPPPIPAEPEPGPEATVVRLQDRRPDPSPSEDDDEELLAAQQALEDAQRRLAQATARRELAAARRTIEAATRRVQDATTARDEAAALVARLSIELEQAQGAVAAAETELGEATAELAEAERIVAQATDRL